MVTFIKVSELVIASIGSLLFNPLFWIVIGITYFMYSKNSNLETRIIGYKISPWVKVKNSVLAGLMAGIMGSGMAVFLGITIEQYSRGSGYLSSGILYLWIIALLLSLIDVRYLCFSYAGGIVAIMNLIFGFPNINPVGIMGLVGILHLMESMLIWLDGYSDAVPALVKRKDGSVVGGYIMNRVWPLPMMILSVVMITVGVGESVPMPDWWPIIRQPGLDLNMGNLMYILQPIPVMLGYGDMAITKSPEKKCKDSAFRLFIYSIVLILLSVIASKIHIFAYIAAVFAPIAHEILILYGQREEQEGKAFFNAPERGLKVLFCRKGYPGLNMKLEPGDIIMSINNVRTDRDEDLSNFLKSNPSYIWLEVVKASGEKITLDYRDYQKGISSLGLLIVPKTPSMYLEVNTKARLLSAIKALKKVVNKKRL
ncbi:hypothetical protein [Lutispora thermophila]|uniref:PDZ domain-containing protein n=1 Tax=Lutispora thermophila DSM 19022 TaxID=1122184 RepID=A0A1M6IML1_9FIRM|nr:hypothetical protein [Lutispora thermophila]SHJ35674.1 hypothetical protein SAMN02745176_03324 [Lutispora thermophila DSM 19022]